MNTKTYVKECSASAIPIQDNNLYNFKFTQIKAMFFDPISSCRMTTYKRSIRKFKFLRVHIQLNDDKNSLVMHSPVKFETGSRYTSTAEPDIIIRAHVGSIESMPRLVHSRSWSLENMTVNLLFFIKS